jgi:hypothetical protein
VRVRVEEVFFEAAADLDLVAAAFFAGAALAVVPVFLAAGALVARGFVAAVFAAACMRLSALNGDIGGERRD